MASSACARSSACSAAPDLVGVHRHMPAFYERVFDRARVAAGEAVVVDDSAAQLVIAAALGARTVLVGDGQDGAPAGNGAFEPDLRIARLEALPAALAALS